MSCPERQELSAYADGELAGAALAAIEKHMAECASCRRDAEDMRRMNALAREALISIPADEGELEEFLVWRRQGALRGLRRCAVAAAIVIAAGVVLWVMTTRPDTTLPRGAGSEAAGTTDTLDDLLKLMSGPKPHANGGDAFDEWIERFRRYGCPVVPLESLAQPSDPMKVYRDTFGLFNYDNG